MKTENTNPSSPPLTTDQSRDRPTREREYQKVFGDTLEESAKIVSPIMMNLGELLEAIFLAKGHNPGAPLKKCVDRTMGFVFSLTWDGEASLEKRSDDDTMLEIFEYFLGNESLSKQPWRELWSDTIFVVDTPLATGTRILLEYAYHGIGPANYNELVDKTVTREDYIKSLTEAAKLAVATLGPDNLATHSLSEVLNAAECRVALDQGRDVTPAQLAALARIGSKSMRNALAPKSGAGLKMRGGAIVAESALNWLRAHGKYLETLWLDEETSSAPLFEPIIGEILFVPFADNEIEFDPIKSRRDGNYTVGPKGAEQTFTDYRAALDCLARMKPASYWKHPNKANNWGTVTAVGFRPRTAEQLGLQPAERGEK
jgi:hypothetical protein